MNSRFHFVSAVALLLLAVGFAAPSHASPKPSAVASTDLIVTESGVAPPSLLYVTLLSTGFEGREGFILGPLDNQNGYMTSGTNLPWASVSNLHPHSEFQHLRLIHDPTVGLGTGRVALSPVVAVAPSTPSTTTEWIFLTNDGGADYDVFGQAPSQAFITWRVKFSYSDATGTGPGTIFILDDIGGVIGFVDTGVVWDTNVWTSLKVQFDPDINEIRYFYNGVQIYTGVVYAGNVVEQVGWRTDNFQLAGEYGDIDDVLLIDTPTDPTAAKPTTWGRIKAAYR